MLWSYLLGRRHLDYLLRVNRNLVNEYLIYSDRRSSMPAAGCDVRRSATYYLRQPDRLDLPLYVNLTVHSSAVIIGASIAVMVVVSYE